MAAQKGEDFLLKAGAVSGSPVTLAGMKTTGMTLNSEAVDVTTKDSGGWRALLQGAGIRSLSVSASGVFTDGTSEETVRAAAFNGTISTYSLFFGNGDTLEFSGQITSYERGGEFNGEETYSLTIESSGTPTYTAAA